MALDDVTLAIGDGERIGLAGATGSGKTTLALHLNGLLQPTAGRVVVSGRDTTGRGLSRRERARLRLELRRTVGVVFQYPEAQLFEETVFDDIAYGPRNLGLPPDEVRARVARAMKDVGLPESLAGRSPFQLSGGQMRRVAIAGVLAMDPEVLVLDEPSAGLDPAGRRALLEIVRRWQSSGRRPRTLVYVSHRMEEMAELCDRIVVLARGRVVADLPPRELFASGRDLAQFGLEPPFAAELCRRLRACGWPLPGDVVRPEEAVRAIAEAKGRARAGRRR